jgi:hypothetical protein
VEFGCSSAHATAARIEASIKSLAGPRGSKPTRVMSPEVTVPVFVDAEGVNAGEPFDRWEFLNKSVAAGKRHD